MQRERLKVILKEKELWFLILLGMVYFYRPLFMGETFYERYLYLHIKGYGRSHPGIPFDQSVYKMILHFDLMIDPEEVILTYKKVV